MRERILSPVWFCFFCLLLASGFFVSCNSNVQASVHVTYLLPKNEMGILLAKRWLVMPFVPTEGPGVLLENYGEFNKRIEEVRPGQRVTYFGEYKFKLSTEQTEAYKLYVRMIQNKREIPDSILMELIVDIPAAVTLAPVMFSNEIHKTIDGMFQKRLVIHFEGWENLKKEKVLSGSCSIFHSSDSKETLESSEKLFNSGLLAIASKLYYSPVAGVAPEGSPDF